MMTPTDRATLISLLTQLDMKESVKHPNIYRLGHYFGAVDSMAEDMAKGKTLAIAFALNFNATAGTAKIARTMKLGLSVERGRWTI